MKYALLAASALALVAAPATAQQTLLADEVLSDDFQDFRGEGLAPGGGAGRLDSNRWRIRLSASIDTDFGYTSTEVELARGVDPGTVGTGGLYAYQVAPGDYALGAQPTIPLFTDGHFETHIVNGTGGALASIDIAFDFCWFNKRDRSQFFRGQLRHPNPSGGMNTSFFFMGATPGPADAPTIWECERVETSVDMSSAPLMPGAVAEIRWFSNDIEGETAGGTRDALALDDVRIATTRCGNGIISTGDACDDGNAVTETECEYGVPTCEACNADCSMALDLTGPFCGDGIVQVEHGEECDPAMAGGPECTAECELVPEMDAGSPELDAGLADDAGALVDAGSPEDDAGAPGDAGMALDAGTSPTDGGPRPMSDAGLPSIDAGPALGRGDGCGCAAPGTGGSPLAPLGLLALLALSIRARRRRRS